MKIQGFFSALALSAAVALPMQASAVSLSVDDLALGDGSITGVLFSKAKWNKNLEEGDYAFAQVHAKGSFLDEWSFSLAQTSDVSISVNDLELALPGSETQALVGGGSKPTNTGYLFDTKFLTFSLFDSAGSLLGTSGENGTLSALNLLAGELYTLTVSGKVNGIFGSAYYGALSINEVQEVPIGSSLPLFGSALLLLAIRASKRFDSRSRNAA